MEYLKRWWFGWKVCRKYGINFNPVYTKDLIGSYEYNRYLEILGYDTNIKLKDNIRVSLFHEDYYEVFLHELGHFMDRKGSKFIRGNLADKILPNKEPDYEDYSLRLFLEARASRYALRLLKSCGKLSKGSESKLKGKLSMASYISCIPTGGKKNLQNKLTLAEVDYKLCRYISGK